MRQFDPNYTQNGYVNYLPGNPNNGNYEVTAHVAGAGTVKLQSGGVDGDTVFGGAWSIDSGILQLGPSTGPPWQPRPPPTLANRAARAAKSSTPWA